MGVISIEAKIALAISAVVVIGGATAYWLSPLGQPAKKEVAASSDQESFNRVTDECLDALLRAWTITDACYDSKNNTYFYKIAPHSHIDGVTDEGWYMLEEFKFIELENGTWFLKSSSSSTEVAPNVAGLRCRTQAADPNWYKDS